MLSNKQGAPKAKFLLPKMSPPSLLLNDDEDFQDKKEIKIPEVDLSDDKDENTNSTKIISILSKYKGFINVNEKPRNGLLYNRRDSNNSIETRSSDKNLVE